MPAQIDISRLWAKHRGTEDWVLTGLELEAGLGECVGIVGNNGSGKSTFAHSLIGVIPYLTPGEVRGTALLDGTDLLTETIDGRLDRVGYAFQDIESQILFGRVADVLGLNEPTSDKTMIMTAVEHFRIGHLLDRSPEELSGGEAQRVALTTALRRGPILIIYDEAIAALDPNMRRVFSRFIEKLRGAGRIPILLGQRYQHIAQNSDITYRLHDGRLEKMAAPDSSGSDVRTTAEKLWRDVAVGARSNVRRPAPLELRSVTYVRKRSGFTLGPIDLNISSGETVAILGPNGAGKTTLLLLLLGVLKASSGRLMLDGVSSRSARTRAWLESVAMLSQSPSEQIVGATIAEELQAGAFMSDSTSGTEAAHRLQDHFPFLEPSRDPFQLSFGQQRMLGLINVLMGPHPIILLEEPEQGLDEVSLEYLRAWFRVNRETRIKTVLFTTHDLELAAQVADRSLLLQGGSLVSEMAGLDVAQIEEWYFLHTEDCGA